jgi:tetratricopeptide (TPR) repeat protein
MRNTTRLPILCVLLSAALAFAGDRDTAAALITSAEKALKNGDYATAKSVCERAIQSDDTYAQAHLMMGQILEAMNQPREAIKSFQAAADAARKENNPQLAQKALDSAKRIAPGLVELNQADQKLFDRLTALGEKAFAEERFDTAKQAFGSALALQPGNEKLKEQLSKTERAIDARGDPVRVKIAAAAMSEVWYYVGSGKKDQARKMAADVASKFADLPTGRDAQRLLDTNFDLSKTLKQDIVAAREELATEQKRLAAARVPTPATPARTDVKSPVQVNLEGAEKTAADEAKKLAKDQLVARHAEYCVKGHEFYSKATPGTEGNQRNLALALEQFIQCEAVYLRLEEQGLLTPAIDKLQEEASMLRYACMKMTILSH